jgi:hypothetical protein
LHYIEFPESMHFVDFYPTPLTLMVCSFWNLSEGDGLRGTDFSVEKYSVFQNRTP